MEITIRCNGRNTKRFESVLGTIEHPGRKDREKAVVWFLPGASPIGGQALMLSWRKWHGETCLFGKRQDLPLLRRLSTFRENSP